MNQQNIRILQELTLPAHFISESCIKIKPFEAPQRSVKIKI